MNTNSRAVVKHYIYSRGEYTSESFFSIRMEFEEKNVCCKIGASCEDLWRLDCSQ